MLSVAGVDKQVSKKPMSMARLELQGMKQLSYEQAVRQLEKKTGRQRGELSVREMDKIHNEATALLDRQVELYHELPLSSAPRLSLMGWGLRLSLSSGGYL